MDTRTKIVPSFEILTSKTIVGYFDPMHAGHVRRLKELCSNGDRLNVVIADPDEPILPAEARAELVAALECVASVVIARSSADHLIHKLTNVVDERPADAVRAREFAQHVVARHNAQ